MDQTIKLVDVTLAGAGFVPASPEMEQNYRVAVFDLLEKNQFEFIRDGELLGYKGPFRMVFSTEAGDLVLEMQDQEEQVLHSVRMPLSAVRNAVRDYNEVCDVYYDAVRALTPSKIEVIDQARKQIHDDGGRILIDQLAGGVRMSQETARSLFTLICVLRFQN